MMPPEFNLVPTLVVRILGHLVARCQLRTPLSLKRAARWTARAFSALKHTSDILRIQARLTRSNVTTFKDSTPTPASQARGASCDRVDISRPCGPADAGVGCGTQTSGHMACRSSSGRA